MKLFIKLSYVFFFGLIIQGCRCNSFFKYDFGLSLEKDYIRFGDIEQKSFLIGIRINSESIQIAPLTHFNAPLLVKDHITKVKFISFNPSFPNGTILELKKRYNEHFKVYDDYYTCKNFTKLIKKNKNLNLTIVYDLDSLGEVTHYTKEYKLVKKRGCHFAVH